MRALLVEFASRGALEEGFARLASARLGKLDTYTPIPIDIDDSGSPLPLLMFIAGMAGFVGFFLLMTYADVRAYPLDIGGRPKFAWPTFIPIAFELGVLCAMAAGFVGFFVLCRMPKLYCPIDDCERFREASRDGWFLAIRVDTLDRSAAARSLIEPLHPSSVEEYFE